MRSLGKICNGKVKLLGKVREEQTLLTAATDNEELFIHACGEENCCDFLNNSDNSVDMVCLYVYLSVYVGISWEDLLN